MLFFKTGTFILLGIHGKHYFFLFLSIIHLRNLKLSPCYISQSIYISISLFQSDHKYLFIYFSLCLSPVMQPFNLFSLRSYIIICNFSQSFSLSLSLVSVDIIHPSCSSMYQLIFLHTYPLS